MASSSRRSNSAEDGIYLWIYFNISTTKLIWFLLGHYLLASFVIRIYASLSRENKNTKQIYNMNDYKLYWQMKSYTTKAKRKYVLTS